MYLSNPIRNFHSIKPLTSFDHRFYITNVTSRKFFMNNKRLCSNTTTVKETTVKEQMFKEEQKLEPKSWADRVRQRFGCSFYINQYVVVHNERNNRIRNWQLRRVVRFAKRGYIHLYREGVFAGEPPSEYSKRLILPALEQIVGSLRVTGLGEDFVVPDYIDEVIQFPPWVPWYWHFIPARREILRDYAVRHFLAFNKDKMRLMESKYIAGFSSAMSKEEALKILGNPPERPDKIKEGHRRLMLINHPDNGGSTFLATKINEAKEFLVKLELQQQEGEAAAPAAAATTPTPSTGATAIPAKSKEEIEMEELLKKMPSCFRSEALAEDLDTYSVIGKLGHKASVS